MVLTSDAQCFCSIPFGPISIMDFVAMENDDMSNICYDVIDLLVVAWLRCRQSLIVIIVNGIRYRWCECDVIANGIYLCLVTSQ